MAFFKFRKSADDAPAAPAQGESVEALRKRATFRLIGAAVLVLAGVIGFPLLFDSQPRPVAVDIKIEIPDKAKVKPLAPLSTGSATSTASAAGEVTANTPAGPSAPIAPPVAAPAATVAPPTVTVTTPPVSEKINESTSSKEKSTSGFLKPSDSATKNDDNSSKKSSNSPVKEDLQKKDKPSDGAKALALLEGKSPEKADASSANAAEGRFVVQVGAFSDAARAKEARTKLESAGLKTYTQVVETKDGARTRVRVGPFSDKAEADRAAQKVKSLDLPAAILSL